MPSLANNLSEEHEDREPTTRLDPPPSSTDSSKPGVSRRLSLPPLKSTTLPTSNRCLFFSLRSFVPRFFWVIIGFSLERIVSSSCKKVSYLVSFSYAAAVSSKRESSLLGEDIVESCEKFALLLSHHSLALASTCRSILCSLLS